jgi:hypothetical protein
MIEIEITKAKDSNYLGQYKYFKNKIIIGNDHDLHIDTDELKELVFHLQINQDEIVLNSDQTLFKFHVNGQIAHFPSYLKINDQFSIQGLNFKIINFNSEPKEPDFQQTMKDKLEKVQKDNLELYQIIKSLN